MSQQTHGAKERVVFSVVTLVFYLAHAATAFVASYLKELGFAAAGVGAVMAILNCVGVVAAPVLGNAADRMNSARRAFLLSVLCAGTLMALVPVVGTRALLGVPLVALLLAAWAFFRIPANSLLDAWTLRRAETSGAFSFGSIRLIGSVSGATMCIVYGKLVLASGTNASALYGYCLFGALSVAVCMTLGKRYDDGFGAARQKGGNMGVREALKSRPFALFLLSHAAMGIPIYCLTTFLPFKLSELGASSDMLGILVALKSYTEVPMLFLGAKCLKKWDAKKLLSLCFLAFLAEHLICAAASNVWVVAAALMAHGLFFGLYLACMTHYVYRITPPQCAASAQSLAGSAALLVAVLGNLVGGPLVDRFGSRGFFLLGTAIFAAATALFVFCAKTKARKSV